MGPFKKFYMKVVGLKFKTSNNIQLGLVKLHSGFSVPIILNNND